MSPDHPRPSEPSDQEPQTPSDPQPDAVLEPQSEISSPDPPPEIAAATSEPPPADEVEIETPPAISEQPPFVPATAPPPEIATATSEPAPTDEVEIETPPATSKQPGFKPEPDNWQDIGVGTPRHPEKTFSQTAQDTWNDVRPVLQAQTVKVLWGTIGLLETIVGKLEKSGAPAPEKRSENLPPTSETVPDKLVPPSLTNELPEKLHTAWQKLQNWWATVLPQIRAQLPAALSDRFSDRALTAAMIAVLILFLWIVPGLFAGKPKPAPIAQAPPVQTVTPPQVKPIIPPSISIPEPAQPLTPQPGEEKSAPKSVVATPAPVPTLTPVPPSPPLKLTPEQKLIARIQDQVAEISNQYVSGLIQSVQANFRSSLLIVKVGNGWYGLSQEQQNKLADEMLGRTQKLNFSKLEITDPEGTLLARSPVVGSEMIILQRQVEAESAAIAP